MEEDYAYGAHFALRVLVLPVLPLRKQEYARQLALLRRHSRIALADIPPITTAGQAVNPLIAPTPASKGFLNLNFVETWDRELAWLNEFQAHRHVMGVVGLLECAEWTGQEGDGDLQDAARTFREMLKEEAPAGVFASRCYAFNPSEHQTDNAEGLVVIPNVGDLDFYVNTLLAELASNMLAGVSQILGALDSKSSVQMPMGRSTSIPWPTYQPSATPGTPSTERSSLSFSGSSVFERSNSPLPPLPPSRPASVAPLPSSPASASDNNDAKARKKQPGRIAKLKGDLLRLAGRPKEAMSSYNEATIIARATNDYAWQAAAIEANIMTQVYQSWTHIPPPGSSTATPRPSISGISSLRAEAPNSAATNSTLAKELPPRYSEALSLYVRASPSNRNSASVGSDNQSTTQLTSSMQTDADTVVHPLLYIESCMRCLRLQLILLLRGGIWDSKTLGLLMGSSSLPWPQLSATELFRQTVQGSVTRADAEASITLAYGQTSSPSLRLQDRLRFLEGISHIYQVLHLRRRRAVIEREISVLLSTEVAQEEAQASEMDLAADISINQNATSVKSHGNAEGAEKVLSLINHACQVYGLPEAKHESEVGASLLPSSNLMIMLNTVFERYGWLELQHALLKEAIRICKLLPDLVGASAYTAMALRTTLDALASNEQRACIEDIRQMNSVAQKRGLDPAYWGPDYPLLSLELLSLPEPMRVVEQVVVPRTAENATTAKQGFSDLLVHSVVRGQGAGGAASAIPTLVQGEPGELSILLNNPYSIAIQVDSVELICRGVACSKFPPISLAIPPLVAQPTTLLCTPLEAGDLQIIGCRIRLAGCPERDFLLPVNAEARGDEILRAFGTSVIDLGRVKHSSPQVWHELKREFLEAYRRMEESTFLSCRVVPKQPLLEAREISLTHGIAMLYQGETSCIQAQLENVTSLEINSLVVTLEDNVTVFQKQRVTSEDVSPQMAYELERDMQQAPVLKLTGKGEYSKVGPKGRLVIDVDCSAKPGLTQGAISIEYASLSPGASQDPIERFFTRTIRLPFAFKVHLCLRCQRWDILRVSRYRAAAMRQHRRNASVTVVGRSTTVGAELEDQLRNLDDETSCILVLEVENTSPRQAFEAVLTGSNSIGAKVTERIESGTTVHLLLPIQRIRLPEEKVHQPIPSPANKQFVVRKGLLPLEELERFWYREELLRSIQLDWREVGSQRSGSCNVRHLSLSDEMLSALKLSDLPLSIEASQDGELCSQDENGKWNVMEGSFVQLTVSVKNLKARALSLRAAIEVANTDQSPDYRSGDINPITRNVILDGIPFVTLPSIAAGEELGSPFSYSLCFMSRGIYDIIVALEEVSEESSVLEEEAEGQVRSRAKVEHKVCFNVS